MDKYAKPGCKFYWITKKARTEEEFALIRWQSHERMTELEHHMLVCQGRCCAKSGSQAVIVQIAFGTETTRQRMRLRSQSGICKELRQMTGRYLIRLWTANS